MQLLPRGMQELPRPKEKPHRSNSWTSKSCYRCGSPGFGLGSGLGSPGALRELAPGKVRVLFVLRQKRQTASAIAIPGKTVIKTSLKKPLCDNQPGKVKSAMIGTRTTGSRKHAVATAHSSSTLPVTAEGRFKRVLRQFIRIYCNSTTTWMSEFFAVGSQPSATSAKPWQATCI